MYIVMTEIFYWIFERYLKDSTSKSGGYVRCSYTEWIKREETGNTEI